ncbi:MAG: cell surface protein, partial [Mobiluncus porci]|nr:cell surface protein [Mobiluncus porci]MDY5749153.1 cell surface protein [Mobiluncus porci]
DENGCSVAPTVTAPDVKGEKGDKVEITVPIANPGKTTIVSCSAEGLPAGLTIALNKEGTACVISGTLKDNTVDGNYTVTVTYDPADNGDGDNGTVTDEGKTVKPGGTTGPTGPQGPTGPTGPQGPAGPAGPSQPPVAGVNEQPNTPNITVQLPQEPPVAGVNTPAPATPAIVTTNPQQPRNLAHTGVDGILGFAGLAVVLLAGGALLTLRGRKENEA